MADILSDISQNPDITLHILDNYIGSAYSPQVAVSEVTGGHEVAITYDDASTGITTKTFDVLDGGTTPESITTEALASRCVTRDKIAQGAVGPDEIGATLGYNVVDGDLQITFV